jgi:O-antigen/teichoic acid export membrane protein
MTASLGNVLAKKGAESLYYITHTLMFFNFWIYSVISIALFYCLAPFIEIWLGADFLLPITVVAILSINFYLRGVCSAANNVIVASGVIYESRRSPIIASMINITVAVILGYWLGLAGVFVGATVSMLFLHLYTYPKFAFRMVFKRKPNEYRLIFFGYFALMLLFMIILYPLMNVITFSAPFITLVVRGIVAVLVPSLFYFLIFRKTSKIEYLRNILQRKLV